MLFERAACGVPGSQEGTVICGALIRTIVAQKRWGTRMRVARSSSFVAAVLTLVVFASASVVLADGRVALVVGNSTYDHIGRLPNPENDAVDMAAVLQRLGFEVTTELDADRVVLTEALRAFTRRSAGRTCRLCSTRGTASRCTA